jgi:outer membrane lipoprotein carrier protein
MRKSFSAIAFVMSSSLLAPALVSAQTAPPSGGGILSWVLPGSPRGKVAATPSATVAMAGVQTFYASITQVTASFRQEVTNVTFGRTDVNDGTLMIKKPGNMRWQYYSKKRKGKVTVAKDFISNGSYLFVVDYENKQIIKKDLSKNLLPTAVTFLYGKGDLAADFTPEIDKSGTYGGKSDLVLKLLPKATSAQYKTLHLVVDPADYHVKESIVVDSAGNKNHFRFHAPNFEKAIEDKFFQFSEKNPNVKSFRVIDGDKADDNGAIDPDAAPTGTPKPTGAGPSTGTAKPAPTPGAMPAPVIPPAPVK